jgi:hypothetical protein
MDKINTSLGREFVEKPHVHPGGFYPVRPTPQGEDAFEAFFLGNQ